LFLLPYLLYIEGSPFQPLLFLKSASHFFKKLKAESSKLKETGKIKEVKKL
jgi:hypothetical protein